jgi:hypothetical protein
MKKTKRSKTKALVIARGVDIFRLLFDTRDDDHRPDRQKNVRLAKVVLPLVDQANVDGENKEKAKKTEETLDSCPRATINNEKRKACRGPHRVSEQGYEISPHV